MTHLIGNLYSVEVPSDATQWKIDTLKEDEEFEEMTILMFDNLEYIKLPSSDFKILGEVTKDKINFPTAEFLRKVIEKQKDFYKGEIIDIEDVTYYNYQNKKFDIEHQSDGFRSLLQSKEIYFENTIEKPKIKTISDRDSVSDNMLKFQQWQESENKVIKGKLIILEKL